MKNLYPEISPYRTFFLDTGSQHAVYVELSGNGDGIPVVFLHGGPCSGTKPDHRRFFNPGLYQIILFDQRGCGQSLPFGELAYNTTQDLIDDMERIRVRLGIKKWLVFGGSWGGALGLLYAQQHQDKVLGLIIRGVFLARQQDMEWFVTLGANRIYPEQWQCLVDCVPKDARNNLVGELWNAINGENTAIKAKVAKEWQAWNGQLAMGKAYQPQNPNEPVSDAMIEQVRMEIHYACHHYFIEENQVIENCGGLQNIPTTIIHGRYDLVCPMEAGLSLHHALPRAEFIVLPNAGHVAQHEEMIDALVSATDRFADLHAI
ncbi:putative proline iminopeptidase Pip [Methyloglobulus morosus KoM1]|uniref:Proline iminopeptidase n=1 Tax=Methyloglobulus morosus KoM1 TaxID=1116472 RepID=V5C4N0_9GAMM|nr:prolyl aminopeptidase [Methyloglobulus morosus]ESS71703.1 putative proline iminopeptidase Pip [Methyloglobulus morosus KoM1]